MKNINDLTDEEFREFRLATIDYAVSIIQQERESTADDGGDYLHGSIDVLNLVKEADQSFTRQPYADLFATPRGESSFSYLAIPTAWDEFWEDEED